MKIINHSYRKKGSIAFTFENFPHSQAIMYPIKNYYFIRTVRWSQLDPVVTRADLEMMEMAANEMMDTLEYYKQRSNFQREYETGFSDKSNMS